jgi:membrane peptidoglycan carboxypeptidase
MAAHRPRSSEPSRARPGCLRRTLGCGWKLTILSLQLAVIGVMLAFVGAAGAYLYLSNQLADAMAEVVAYQGTGAGGTPRFFDRNGQLLFELKTAEKRRWLRYEEIPENVIQATVAVEDDTFWQNPGFDAPAIAAAIVANWRNEGARPVGASTITQQLVRHIAFSYEERVATSYERKVREIFLAFILTQQRSKVDILTMYLNEIYYGNLAYGIEAAAQTYFAKPAAALSLAESAFLAGLPQSPVELNPYANFEGAQARKERVLELMASEGMIDRVTLEVARGTELHLAPLIPIQEEVSAVTLHAAHFVIYVQQELERRYGPDALIHGGWQVTTSLDLGVQQMAETTLREQIAASAAAHDVNNGAAVVLRPDTGEILAMVGSLDYFDQSIDGQVNVALRLRQPGSAIKPLTYAAAMERGWTTGDVLWDVPIALDAGNGEEFIPVNYDGRYHGPLLLRDALANSYNIPPIHLIRDVGVGTVIATARKMGVVSLNESPGFYGLTLTLGGGDVRLLELTHAFATLANRGERPRLQSVLRIVNGRDQVVYDVARERLPATRALDPRIAYILTDILDDDAARTPAFGTNNPLNAPFPAAVKTGTTNDFRDNWTIGYTPAVVVGIWVGNTDGHPMRNSSGLTGAAPIWRAIIEGIYRDPALVASLYTHGEPPPLEFERPPGLEEREVCLPRGTGGSSCTATRTDLFLTGGPQRGIPRLGYVPDMSSNPGAWTLSVLPLPGDTAATISQPALSNGYQPPAPTSCVVNSRATLDGVQQRLFLPVPPYYPDEVRARLWLQRYGGGYEMAPSVACPAGVVRAARGETVGRNASTGGNSGFVGSTYHITAPAPGQQVNGIIQILGTARFDPAQYQYYKLEIGSGRAPETWTTLGTTHSGPVVNGLLEELHTYALPPGPYVLRLVVVRNDGNYPAPYAVPITITE